jgi:hypothetical protein
MYYTTTDLMPENLSKPRKTMENETFKNEALTLKQQYKENLEKEEAKLKEFISWQRQAFAQLVKLQDNICEFKNKLRILEDKLANDDESSTSS